MKLGLFLGMWADKAKYPVADPEFASHIGWLVFALFVVTAIWAWTRSASIRRSILGLTDPRVFAVLRIGFALMTIMNFLNMAPYWRMLWSDEGIFDLFYAQDRLGRSALRGWTPDEGFFDGWAVLNFLWNKPSALYVWGSPAFVIGYMLVFFGILLMYAAGMFSRTTGVVAWLMMTGIYVRNALYWEGTDTVYRSFWFILLFARTGYAWSFDNWWRCRRLRKKGRLREANAPPDAPGEPIYRLVPGWTRYLFMAQVAALYITTGAVKTGGVWEIGDALYYALNMDHFYRFELATQYVSAAIGTTVFRFMTWTTLWWERCFPLVVVGMVLKFGVENRGKPWYPAGWRKWIGRLALAGGVVLAYRINVMSLPYCLSMREDTPQDATESLRKLHIWWGIVLPVVAAVWFALGRWPIRLFEGGRNIPLLTKRITWLRIPEINFDQQRMRAWLFGRRVWLTLGVMFHGFLILFMNIGMFPFITLMTYAGFVGGEEWARIFSRLVLFLRRTPMRRWVPGHADAWFIPAQRHEDVRLRGRTIPDVLVLLLGAAGVALVYFKIDKATWVGDATYGWLVLCVGVALVFRLIRPRAADVAAAKETGPAMALGAIGRTVVLFAVVWHTTAVGFHLFPSYPVFSRWRSQSRGVYGSWLRGTGTSQSWRMFAPNPPRSNTFMQTVVVMADGSRWDLGNNAYSYRPNPWIINDRMRKMQRRMVGKGKWYLRYWASYHCREWTLSTGEQPLEIEINSISSRIPTPDMVRFDAKGPYDPRKLKVREKNVQTHKCDKGGHLPLYMKQRYGLPISDEDRAEAEAAQERQAKKYENRRDAWERRTDWGRSRQNPIPRKPTAAVKPPMPRPAAPPAKSGDGK